MLRLPHRAVAAIARRDGATRHHQQAAVDAAIQCAIAKPTQFAMPMPPASLAVSSVASISGCSSSLGASCSQRASGPMLSSSATAIDGEWKHDIAAQRAEHQCGGDSSAADDAGDERQPLPAPRHASSRRSRSRATALRNKQRFE